mmetsp:Transcript_45345/g.61510  ORF Transcript_45345/g.61510 Transcript_45345/m.61510 type:complete len:236 (-) Transcript_45345:76-783(-)
MLCSECACYDDADVEVTRALPSDYAPTAGKVTPLEDKTDKPKLFASEAAQDNEDAHPSRFRCVLEKKTLDSPLGIHLDVADGNTLYVCKVRPGANPALTYNELAAKGQELRDGDFITKVNGVEGDSRRLAEELKSTLRVELEVCRPVEMRLAVSKQGGGLGLDLHYADQCNTLVVETVKAGAIQEFNRGNPMGALERHDHIVSVNGKAGTSPELMAALRNHDPIELVFVRPSPSV